MTIPIAAVLAFVMAWLVARLLASGRGLVALDYPNERSLHDTPTPRTGGLGMIAGLVAGQGVVVLAGVSPAPPAVLIGALAAVVAVSLWDDLRGLSVSARMLVHVGAAVALVYSGSRLAAIALPGIRLDIAPGVALVLSVLGVVWMTNLYNFMDGMDGLAGGMGVIGFATFALLAWRAGDVALASLSAIVACASAGFLMMNFPPARIFMGDTGSSLLGFLAAAIALEAARSDVFTLWQSLLVFSPFVVDATVTLIRRALGGEAVWRAHRSHFYQRLVRLGWSHRRTALGEYVLMALCATSAVALGGAPWMLQASVLCAWVVVYATLMLYVNHMEKARAAA
jgi:UDP-N-acetylmuramyl pentapeptide phosphotransferase/UDP-N-acetylglucosamine-1-phosphate transferase